MLEHALRPALSWSHFGDLKSTESGYSGCKQRGFACFISRHTRRFLRARLPNAMVRFGSDNNTRDKGTKRDRRNIEKPSIKNLTNQQS